MLEAHARGHGHVAQDFTEIVKVVSWRYLLSIGIATLVCSLILCGDWCHVSSPVFDFFHVGLMVDFCIFSCWYLRCPRSAFCSFLLVSFLMLAFS